MVDKYKTEFLLLLRCTYARYHVFYLDFFISIDIIALRNICYAMVARAIKCMYALSE